MYCRTCKYDLRGQVEHRCPECGRTFSLDDPDTYLSVIPGRLRVLAGVVGKALCLSPITLTIAFVILICAHLFLPRLSGGPEWSLRPISQGNLRSIVGEWLVQHHDHPDIRRFDLKQARSRIPPRLSAWTDQSVLWGQLNWWRTYKRHAWMIHAVLIYTVLMIPACHRHWKRRRAIPWLATVLVAIVILVGNNLRSIVRFIQPGSHTFLNDYAYVDDPDWNVPPAKQSSTILAYEKQTRPTGERYVGFMDGSVGWVSEADLEARLAAQGVTLNRQ